MRKESNRTYQFLFLDELDVSQSFGCKFNCLIEAIFTSVRHINNLNHFRLQPLQHTHNAQLSLLTIIIVIIIISSVVTVIETGTETAVFFAKPNRNRGFMPLY